MEQAAGTDWLSVGVFGAFTVMVLVLSSLLGRRASSVGGYFAAHGQVGWFVNGVAFAGDYLSAASFLGICGLIAFWGFDGFLYSIGYLAGWIVALLVIAEPIRRLGRFTLHCAPKSEVAAPETVRPDPLTHASVQLKIKKGETTQNDVVEAFGAPNIMTTDGDGREVWTYRRHATVSSVAGTDAYFNVLVFGTEDRRANQATSSRSMTLVIKFDAKWIVSDFQSLSTSF